MLQKQASATIITPLQRQANLTSASPAPSFIDANSSIINSGTHSSGSRVPSQEPSSQVFETQYIPLNSRSSTANRDGRSYHYHTPSDGSSVQYHTVGSGRQYQPHRTPSHNSTNSQGAVCTAPPSQLNTRSHSNEYLLHYLNRPDLSLSRQSMMSASPYG